MFEVRQTARFAEWLKSLRDERARTRIVGRIARLQLGLYGDVKRFDGLIELRIDHGPGYRLYAVERHGTIVILLCGGDKGSQRRDIVVARQMLGELIDGDLE